MKTAAVICEYNPMHKGHIFQIAEIKRRIGEDAALLCLMSGDFVQRGEPAVYDKYERAKTAVENGADLVLELPYPWSCSVAEHFAAGALSILRDLCIVDDLFFGSEEKSEKELEKTAERFSSPDFENAVRALRKEHKNLSYPRLRDLAYRELYADGPDLSQNEILGCEYIRASKRIGCSFAFTALPMLSGVSASGAREAIARSGVENAAFLENGGRALISYLLLSGEKSRFSPAAREAEDLSRLFELTRTPNDTDARLKRELLSTVLRAGQVEKEKPAFTVLLAASGKGKTLLSRLRKCSRIPIVTKKAAFKAENEAKKQYELYLRAQDLYSVFVTRQTRASQIMRKKPYISEKV